MARFIKLPNSVIVDADLIQFIGRQELNDYVIFIKDCPMQLKLDGKSLEVLEAFLGVKVLDALPELPRVAIA
jgi:hypothetical protein